MEIVLKKRSFSKRSFLKTIVFLNRFKTIVFKKLVVSSTIVNDKNETIEQQIEKRSFNDRFQKRLTTLDKDVRMYIYKLLSYFTKSLNKAEDSI